MHIGTGNYNQRTATRYEDLGLLTADPRVGADVTHLFNFLTGYGRGIGYDTLLVAPDSLRKSLGEFIDNEIRGGDGRIIMKMNSLVDPDLIDRLYLGSSGGRGIDLIVRGICCLRPGVRGMSENIRVRSIVGRYLEHSRIYAFANGDGPGKPVYLIGSADLMPRNLDRRVEVLVRVDDPTCRRSCKRSSMSRWPTTTCRGSSTAMVSGPARNVLRDSIRNSGSSTRRAAALPAESVPAGPTKAVVRAAGGLVVREGRDGAEVLLVHRPRYDDWTFPKGKVDPGESDEDAADARSRRRDRLPVLARSRIALDSILRRTRSTQARSLLAHACGRRRVRRE